MNILRAGRVTTASGNEIPKLLHYVWVGGRRLPDRFRRNIDSWKKHNPDFTVVCWDESSIDMSHPFVVRACAEGAWAKLSDLVRLSAIAEHGGIYLDTDVEAIRPFKSLLACQCFVGYQNLFRSDEPVCNAVIGARPKHPFVVEALACFPSDDPRRLNEVGTGPELLSRLLVARGLPPESPQAVTVAGVTVFPRPVFYPYHWSETYRPRCVRPETLAIHHWDMSWHDDGKSDVRRRLLSRVKEYPWLYRGLRASYHGFKKALSDVRP